MKLEKPKVLKKLISMSKIKRRAINNWWIMNDRTRSKEEEKIRDRCKNRKENSNKKVIGIQTTSKEKRSINRKKM